MDFYQIAFIALIGAFIGGGIGHALRRREDAKKIAALEQQAAENRQLRKRLAVTLCRYRAKSHAVKRLQKYVDQNWYGEVGEVDEYLMRDRSME